MSNEPNDTGSQAELKIKWLTAQKEKAVELGRELRQEGLGCLHTSPPAGLKETVGSEVFDNRYGGFTTGMGFAFGKGIPGSQCQRRLLRQMPKREQANPFSPGIEYGKVPYGRNILRVVNFIPRGNPSRSAEENNKDLLDDLNLTGHLEQETGIIGSIFTI